MWLKANLERKFYMQEDPREVIRLKKFHYWLLFNQPR